MELTLLDLIIYLSGVIISYPIGKYLHIKTQECDFEWSQFDRMYIIFLSLFSWLMIFAFAFMVGNFLLFKKFKDKKANW